MIISWILLAVFIIEVILLFVVTTSIRKGPFASLSGVVRKKKIKTRYRLLAALAFLLLFAITLKFSAFPPTKDIPVTGE